MRAIWIVPVIASILILGLFGVQEAFASHSVVVTPSTQTGPIGVTQTYAFDVRGGGSWHVTGPGTIFSNTIGCPFPAADFIPLVKINTPPPSGSTIDVNSGVPGSFDCVYAIRDGFGRGSHNVPFSITAVFQPLPPSFTCGAGTEISGSDCVVDPAITGALATCEGARDTFEFDLGVCGADLGVCEGDLGVCEGDRDAFEFGLGVCEGERDAFEFDLGVCDANLAICLDVDDDDVDDDDVDDAEVDDD